MLTQFCSGLQSLNFLDILRRIPNTFKPLFVYDETQDTSDVIIASLSFPSKMTTREEAVRNHLLQYLREGSESGNLSLSHSHPLSLALFAHSPSCSNKGARPAEILSSSTAHIILKAFCLGIAVACIVLYSSRVKVYSSNA